MPSADDLENLDRFHTLVKMQLDGQTLPAFSMMTLPPLPPKDEADATIEDIQNRSRSEYGTHRDDVDKELGEGFSDDDDSADDESDDRRPHLTQMTSSRAERARNLSFRQRAAQPPPVTLRERDLRVMAKLDKYKVLTVDQIEVLEFFSPTRTLAPKVKGRLQKLFHNAYVARVMVDTFIGSGRRPTIYSIDQKGAELVAHLTGDTPSKISWLTEEYRYKDEAHLDHDIVLNNFWVVVERLAQDGHFQLVDSITAFKFKSREMKGKVPFIKLGTTIRRKEPDAYFALQFADRPRPYHFFCEQDQGTKSRKYWQEKVKAYLKFRGDGLSEKFYGTKQFRVLTKTTNPKRLDNLMKWTKEAGGDEYFGSLPKTSSTSGNQRPS